MGKIELINNMIDEITIIIWYIKIEFMIDEITFNPSLDQRAPYPFATLISKNISMFIQEQWSNNE